MRRHARSGLRERKSFCTTAPCSGHVCGRGAFQCHARRTRATSPTAPPANDASRLSGPSEYQATQ